MSDHDVHKTGIHIEVKENLAKILQSYTKSLKTVHGQLNELRGAFAKVDSDSLKGLGKQAEQMAKILGSNGQLLKLVNEKAKIEQQNGQLQERSQQHQARMLVIAQQLKTEKGRSLSIGQQIARNEETHQAKMLDMTERLAIIKKRADDESQAASLRMQMLQERLISLQEKRNAKIQKETADEQKILSIRQRIAHLMPEKGNYIGYGQQAISQGSSILGGIVGIGHSKAVERLQHEQMAIAGLGLSAKDNGTLNQGAKWAAANVQGVDQAKGLEVVKDIYGVLGNAKEATDPRLVRTVAQMMVQDKVKYHFNEHQIQRALMAADQMVKDTPEMKRMDHKSEAYKEAVADQILGNLNTVQKGIAGSGARVKPNEWANMLSSAGSARFGLTNDALLDEIGLVKEKGGFKTGTLLNAFNDQIVNLNMADKNVMALQKAGLLDPSSKIVLDKKGSLDKKHSHLQLIDRALAVSNPSQWQDKHIAPLADALKTQDEKLALINSFGGRKTTRDYLVSHYMQRTTLHREAQAAKNAHDVRGGYADIQGSYGMAEERLQTAKDNLIQAVSPAAMESAARGMNALAAGIETLTAVLERHPGLAKAGVGAAGLAGAGLMAGGAGFIAKGAWDGLKFLGGGAKGIGKTLGMGGEGAEAGVGAVARIGPMLEGILAAVTELAAAFPGLGWGVAAVGAVILGGIAAWKTNFFGFRSVVTGVAHLIHAAWVTGVKGMGSIWHSTVDAMKKVWATLPAAIEASIKAHPMLAKLLSLGGSLVGGALNAVTGGASGALWEGAKAIFDPKNQANAQKWAEGFADAAAKEDAAVSGSADRGVTVKKVDIHVHGSGDPHKTAKETRRALHKLPTHPALAHAPGR